MAQKKSALAAAQQLDNFGFNVLPAGYKKKTPGVNWRQYQTKRTTPKLVSWFKEGKLYNFWIACGKISGLVVLDIDSPEAEAFWREKLGDEIFDTTCCVQTAKGRHYYFRLPKGESFESWSRHEDDISFDVRGDGTGVIAPPSMHESGVEYEWLRDPSHMVDVPDKLRKPKEGKGEGSGGQGKATVRSMLSELLRKPPVGEGGRNDWLTKIAGHYARQYRNQRDLYDTHIYTAAAMLDPPLSEEEIEKVQESIWRTEQDKLDEEVELDDKAGWLVGRDKCLWTLVRAGKGKDARFSLTEWADFDIEVIGVAYTEDETPIWQVKLYRKIKSEPIETVIESRHLSSTHSLGMWLSDHEISIIPPIRDVFPGGRCERLLRYVVNQDAPVYKTVPALGWHDGIGFVTHDEIIFADEVKSHEGVIPAPHTKQRALYKYGFVDSQEAQQVLAQVLTFHEEETTAVFGAWWAACFLKSQIMEETALFPFMALEAPSESGKTTGFFSMMMQLAGNMGGHGEFTLAAMRDAVSAHINGPVWIDDMADPAPILDILRQVTSGGSRTKKGQDKFSQERVDLVSPVVISGESLAAIRTEKALLDRAIRLEVSSPTGRMSLIDPTRPQWDDIQELRHHYHNNLSQMAGTMVQMALGQLAQVHNLKTLRVGAGRHGDKIGVLRVGARVLAEMSGTKNVIELVDAWCEANPGQGAENELTLNVLPTLLRINNWPTRIRYEGTGPTPVWVEKDGLVYFHVEAAASAWKTFQHGRVVVRTQSAEALDQQRKALGVAGAWYSKRRWTDADRNKPCLRVWRLSEEYSTKVIRRSRGVTDGDGYEDDSNRLPDPSDQISLLDEQDD